MDHVKRLLFGWYVLTGPRAQNNSFAGFSDWMFIALGGVLAAARSGGGKREPLQVDFECHSCQAPISDSASSQSIPLYGSG